MSHLAAALFEKVAGIDMVHVAYRGTGQSIVDLIGGRIEIVFATLPPSLQLIQERKVRAIAVTGSRRSETMPDVPTVAEMGYKDFETSQWYGILAPAGTPADIVKKLQEESYKALRSSAVTERFATDNAVAGGGPQKEFVAYIAREQKIWSDIVKRAGIKAD